MKKTEKNGKLSILKLLSIMVILVMIRNLEHKF